MGLSGGKGVKVMCIHLKTKNDAKEYAKTLLGKNKGVMIEEKIIGKEFTIQAITDGINTIFPPITYDYPNRYNKDEGAGGMGSFNLKDGTLDILG